MVRVQTIPVDPCAMNGRIGLFDVQFRLGAVDSVVYSASTCSCEDFWRIPSPRIVSLAGRVHRRL